MKQLLVLIALIVLASCRPETYVPKPRAYFKVGFPEHKYQVFDDPQYPYTFEYPVYARISKDTSFFNSKPDNPYWINMNFGALGGEVYLTYKSIQKSEDYNKLMEDAYKMSYFHNKKADYIVDKQYITPNGVFGVFYNVGGDAATNYQFCATDSLHHFIWGSLYFDVTPNKDSLKPVADFIKADMEHLINTLKWQ